MFSSRHLIQSNFKILKNENFKCISGVTFGEFWSFGGHGRESIDWFFKSIRYRWCRSPFGNFVLCSHRGEGCQELF